MEKEKKLAVLIDAENISSKYIDLILGEANKHGNIIYKRVYGNWTTQQMSSWKKVILDNCIQPIQQYNNASGKNSTDSALIIDAMDLLFLDRLDGFCIVASDSDYTRLAARLRESEMFVLGMGEQKTPQSFISACHEFKYLDLLYNAISSDNKAISGDLAMSTTLDTDLVDDQSDALTEKDGQDIIVKAEEKAGSSLEIIKKALRELAEENSNDEGWIFSGILGGLLKKRFPDFDVRNFQAKKFVSFVKSLDLFETKDISDTENATILHTYFKLK